MKNMVDALNEVYGSVIKKTDIKIVRKTVSFDLTIVDSEKTSRHELKFINRTSFLWVEKDAESNEFNDNYDFSECDYYELTSIDLAEINITSNDRRFRQFPLEYNVVIEIWNSPLLIKADKVVVVDGHQYPLPWQLLPLKVKIDINLLTVIMWKCSRCKCNDSSVSTDNI